MSKTSSFSPQNPIQEPTVGMLLGSTNKRLHDSLRRASESVGMPQSYYPFLFHLHFEDGVTQMELARKLRLSAPTVSVTLSKMERDGLLIRMQDENDQRTIRVYLTQEGRDVNLRIHCEIEKVDACLIKGFSQAECELMKELLRRMNENLEGINL